MWLKDIYGSMKEAPAGMPMSSHWRWILKTDHWCRYVLRRMAQGQTEGERRWRGGETGQGNGMGRQFCFIKWLLKKCATLRQQPFSDLPLLTDIVAPVKEGKVGEGQNWVERGEKRGREVARGGGSSGDGACWILPTLLQTSLPPWSSRTCTSYRASTGPSRATAEQDAYEVVPSKASQSTPAPLDTKK